MSKATLASLLAAQPPPDPLDYRKGMDHDVFLENQALFNRKLLDYVRRLMQQITGPNLVNEILVQNLVVQFLNNQLTAKGDLLTHNGTDSVRLPVGGTNGHVLTVDSAAANGIKWAAAAGGSLTVYGPETRDGSLDSISFTGGAGSKAQKFTQKLTIHAGALNSVGAVIEIEAGGTLTGGFSGTNDVGIKCYLGGTHGALPNHPQLAFGGLYSWKLKWIGVTRLTGTLGKVVVLEEVSITDDAAVSSMSTAFSSGTKGESHQYRCYEVTLNTANPHDFEVEINWPDNSPVGTQIAAMRFLFGKKIK